jgi:toxin YoeB
MNLTFSPQAWADHIYWQTTQPRMVERINELLCDVLRDPHGGIGKPEPLRHRGYWSRRIDQKHRLVYRPTEGAILIAQCRFHY